MSQSDLKPDQRKRYRTIVADPPWHYEANWPVGRIPAGAEHDGRRNSMPYEMMTVDEIKALPVRTLAEPSGAHLYLWTTNRYLRDAFEVCAAWGFRHSQVLAWVKTPRPMMIGGTYAPNLEFVLFARRGSLKHLSRHPTCWFHWPWTAHSVKPDAFLDTVEQVSPGPYVELFARRARFGWDYWGNESLGTAEMAA